MCIVFFREVASDLASKWPDGVQPAIEEKFQTTLAQFNQHNNQHCEQDPTYKFWCSYLQMVHVMLTFLRATREGDWELHLSAIRCMLPWFFAYDRVNYARYLTIYWTEMNNLPTTHPHVHRHLLAGEFGVQRQKAHGFAKVACDQTIEQTINRDAKTKGGWTGFTQQKGAVTRWIMSSHARGQITRQCELAAGQSIEENVVRKDLDPSARMRNEAMICDVQEYLTTRVNPFTMQNNTLMNISSGAVAREDIKYDLDAAEVRGEAKLNEFLEDRIVKSGGRSVFDPIKANKLKTFAHNNTKTSPTKAGNERTALMSSKSLLTRLLVIAQVREVNLEEVLTYELADVPFALGNVDGSMTKTDKAATMRHVEKQVPELLAPHMPGGHALIVDGMVVLRQIKHPPSTFNELSLTILQRIVTQAVAEGATRVDVVMDTYPEISIKGSERARRAAAGVQVFRVVNGEQKVPQKFQQFLGSGKNKENLVSFLFTHWQSCDNHVLQNTDIYFAHGNTCHILKDEDGTVTCHRVPELTCDHEEADTRLLFHAKHASAQYSRIVILSPDTDVFLLAVSHVHQLHCELFQHVTGSKERTFAISKLKAVYTPSMCSALIGLHCFTGCDSVSAFRGKGKIKAQSLLEKHPEFVDCFASLGVDWVVSQDLLCELERFVCLLYGYPTQTSINDVRYQVFKGKSSSEAAMPPNQDCLIQHSQRAGYQAAIHRRCLDSLIEAPSPVEHGWILQDDQLAFRWMTMPPVPATITDFVHCNCKMTSCKDGRCSCKRANLPCTDLCGCCDCCNADTEEMTEDEVSEDPSSSDSEMEDEDID
jgi:hypothetical protein